MASTAYKRASMDSFRQINMLTQYMKDFPEILAAEIKQTVLGREDSYYGYVLLPDRFTDEAVVKTLNYCDPQDKYFAQLTAQLNLDLVWYDDVGRHIMVWSETKSKTDIALWAINRWLEVGPPQKEDFKWERQGNDGFNKHY